MHWVLRSSKWMLASQVLRLISAFWLGTWMARALGPDQFGTWSAIVSWCGVAVCGTEIGVRQVLLKYLSQRPHLAPLLAGTAFRIWTLAAVCCVGIMAIINWCIADSIPWVVFFAATSPLLFWGFTVHHTVLDSRQRADVAARNSAISITLAAALRLAMLIWLPTLTALAWSTAAESLLLLFLAGRAGKFYSSSWLPHAWSSRVARLLINRGIVLLFGHVAMVLLLRLDVIMLERLHSKAEAGIYGAAIRLSELFYFVCPMMVTLLLPKLSQFVRSDPQRFHEIAKLGSRVMVLLASGSIIIMLASGHIAVDFLFGHAYEASAKVLMIHAFASLPYFMMEWRYAVLVATDQGRWNAGLLWLAVICNLGLNILWIPTHGAIGAAWATAISYTIGGLVATWFMPSMRWFAVSQTSALLTPLWLLLSPIKHWHEVRALLLGNSNR